MEKKNGKGTTQLMYGLKAGAARRLGIGERVLGMGMICQRVPNARVAEITEEAKLMMAGKAPVKEPKVPIDLTTHTRRGDPRIRRKSDPDKAVPLVAKWLTETEGKISYQEIRRRLHAEGIGLGSAVVAQMRRELGYERLHYDRPVHLSPEAKGLTAAERAEELGVTLEKVPVESEPERTAPALMETHPLVALVKALAESHGITYLHWEVGKELVIHEAHERRFTV